MKKYKVFLAYFEEVETEEELLNKMADKEGMFEIAEQTTFELVEEW